jgi:prevent-host-death family protein
MRTVSALDVRRHFGSLLDEAAAGERIVIERAGEARAALVPISDLEELEPAHALARKREALGLLRRMAQRQPAREGFDAAASMRRMRDERAATVTSAATRNRRRR